MRYELNVETGEVIEREPTPEELEQERLDLLASAAARAEKNAAEAARLAARESALVKLAALGLTDEEISALVGA